MAPSRSGNGGNQFDDDDPSADKSTHISENNRLSSGGKQATLRKGEPALGTANPDLERFLPSGVITDEEYICEIRSALRHVPRPGTRTSNAVPVEVNSRIAVRIRDATLRC